MRLLLFIFFIVCSHTTTNAQKVKVTVMDDKEPVPYAYIGVNNQIISHTDSLGICYLPMKDLVIGDTIYASYVSDQLVSAIYTEQMKDAGKCELKYKYSMFGAVLDEVVVSGSAEKFLSKSLKNSYALYVNGMVEADFEVSFTNDSLEQPIRGTLKAENRVRGRGVKRFLEHGRFHLLHEVNTLDDTVGMDYQLRRDIHFALRSIANGHYSSSSRLMYSKTHYQKYGYLGEEDNLMKFLITYKPKDNDQEIWQSILYVDKLSRRLIRTNVSALVPHQHFKGDVDIYYNEYVHKRKKMLIQKSIDYNSVIKGNISHVKITNIVFEAK